MNIFVTNSNPTKSAAYLDDKRVVKMVLESTQMLCTALNEIAGKQIAPYKSTHINHPCNKWARENINNWMWLFDHTYALCLEYTDRYNKEHKCEGVLISLFQHRHLLPSSYSITPFPNCARNKTLGIDFTHIKNVYKAYKLYLEERWKTDKRKPTWYKKEK